MVPLLAADYLPHRSPSLRSGNAAEHLVVPHSWTQPGDTSSKSKRVLLNLFGPMGRLTPADRFATANTPVNGITETPANGIAKTHSDPNHGEGSGFGRAQQVV